MSRGPGRIERAIRIAFAENPSRTFTVEELAPLAYPGLNRIEKKHRVAILRAAGRAAAAAGWWSWQSEQPGHAVVFLNPVDVRSYALGRLRTDFLDATRPIGALEARLDDPTVFHSCWRLVQPGGIWWRHVEIHRVERDGDRERAAALRDELNAEVRVKLARLPPL